jgi:starch synthase (maltosyl-transferring)
VLFYGKMTPDRSNMVFIAVNLDPFDEHEASLEFPIAEMGLETTDTFEVVELLTGARHLWRGSRQRVVLDPEVNPCAIYRVGGWEQVDYLSPCF